MDGPARCEEVLRLVGLSSVGNKKVRGFSLGMKQRLGLAMALLGSPDVLLLDEPFNGLDPEATRAMRNLIVRVNETSGITVVVSSHVLDQLDRMATRYGVIADGRMVREMTAEEVAAECRSSLAAFAPRTRPGRWHFWKRRIPRSPSKRSRMGPLLSRGTTTMVLSAVCLPAPVRWCVSCPKTTAIWKSTSWN